MASFSSLPLHILHQLSFFVHPSDLFSFTYTCKSTSLLEVSGNALKLHRARLCKSKGVDNEKESTLVDLLLECMQDPWAGYYIDKLEIIHGRDSWDSEWIKVHCREEGWEIDETDSDGERTQKERSIKGFLLNYLRGYIKYHDIDYSNQATRIATENAMLYSAKSELRSQYSAEHLKLLEKAVFDAGFIADAEKPFWMEEIKRGSEVPVIALLLPRLTMLKELVCSDPLTLQCLSQTLRLMALDPACRPPSAFRSLKELTVTNSSREDAVLASVLPFMTLPALRKAEIAVCSSSTSTIECDETLSLILDSTTTTLSCFELGNTSMSLTPFTRLLGCLKNLNDLSIEHGIIRDLSLPYENGFSTSISQTLSNLKLSNLSINVPSLVFLLSSSSSLKKFVIEGVTVETGNSKTELIKLKPRSSTISGIHINSTAITSKVLEALIAFPKKLEKFSMRNSRYQERCSVLLPEVIRSLQLSACNTLDELTLQRTEPIDAVSMPSLRDFETLTFLSIDSCILLGKIKPKPCDEPEKQDAWLATLPSLAELLPASLRTLKLESGPFSVGEYTSNKEEKYEALRPWSTRIAEHFERNYASTPCLSKIFYNVYDSRYRDRFYLEGVPEVNERIDVALQLHGVSRQLPYKWGGKSCSLRVPPYYRTISTPLDSKVVGADMSLSGLLEP